MEKKQTNELARQCGHQASKKRGSFEMFLKYHQSFHITLNFIVSSQKGNFKAQLYEKKALESIFLV